MYRCWPAGMQRNGLQMFFGKDQTSADLYKTKLQERYKDSADRCSSFTLALRTNKRHNRLATWRAIGFIGYSDLEVD